MVVEEADAAMATAAVAAVVTSALLAALVVLLLLELVEVFVVVVGGAVVFFSTGTQTFSCSLWWEPLETGYCRRNVELAAAFSPGVITGSCFAF